MKSFYKFINENYDEKTIYNFNEKELDDIVKRASIELGYTDLKYLGGGDYGKAYKTKDNKVLKITIDKDEAEIANYLRNKNTTYLINYYDVRKIKNTDFYCLIMDYAEPLTKSEKEFIIQFRQFIWSINQKEKIRIYDIKKEQIQKFLNDMEEHKTRMSKLTPPDGYHGYHNTEYLSYSEQIKILKDLENIQKEGEKYNLKCVDLRADNLGWINDKSGKHLVFFDIGVEKNYKKNKKTLNQIN